MYTDLIILIVTLVGIFSIGVVTVFILVLPNLIRASPIKTTQPDAADAAEIYRVAFRSTDAPFESSHEYALGVVYEAGLKAGRRVEVPA